MTTWSDKAARLRWARQKAGFAEAKDATDRFGWAYPTYASHENGSRGFKNQRAQEYAKAFRVNFTWLVAGIGAPLSGYTIPIEGYVGSGARIYPVDDQRYVAEDGLEQVELPPGATNDLIAFLVRGDSNYPVYRDGDVIFVGRDGGSPDRYINEECVVRLADGSRMLKTIAKGADDRSFTLISANHPPIIGQQIEWASPVEWVKRAKR